MLAKSSFFQPILLFPGALRKILRQLRVRRLRVRVAQKSLDATRRRRPSDVLSRKLGGEMRRVKASPRKASRHCKHTHLNSEGGSISTTADLLVLTG